MRRRKNVTQCNAIPDINTTTNTQSRLYLEKTAGHFRTYARLSNVPNVLIMLRDKQQHVPLAYLGRKKHFNWYVLPCPDIPGTRNRPSIIAASSCHQASRHRSSSVTPSAEAPGQARKHESHTAEQRCPGSRPEPVLDDPDGRRQRYRAAIQGGRERLTHVACKTQGRVLQLRKVRRASRGGASTNSPNTLM